MKNIILLIAVLVVGACASVPTVKSVAGTYEQKKDGDTARIVFLENGIVEEYANGKKEEEVEHKWSISKEGGIHVTIHDETTGIWRINKDSSITLIAGAFKVGKNSPRIWQYYPKEAHMTFKKIK